jgi:phosphatidylglycerol:prolipoprotein diacylglycerol transferase
MSNVYPIIFAIGVLGSLVWLGVGGSVSGKAQTLVRAHRRIDTGTISLLGGLIGARSGYIIDRLDYFKLFPNKAFWIWDGGLSWIGAVVGVLIGVGIFAWVKHEKYLSLLDSIALPASFIGFVSWFGCLIDGCGYGREAHFGILTPPSPDIFGVELNRFPVQGAGAILHLLTILYLYNLQKRELASGILSGAALLMISLGNLLLLFFRGDSVRIISGIRLDAIATLRLVGLAAISLMVITRKQKGQTS